MISSLVPLLAEAGGVTAFCVLGIPAFWVACVASVSNRVTTRKLEQEQKKRGGRGRERGEEETLARKPHDSEKRPLIFHGSVDL